MECSDEPLNLTIKKKPVAIVAPSSIIDINQKFKTVNNIKEINEDDCFNDAFNYDKVEECPQDLSLKKHNECSMNNNFSNNKFNDKLKAPSQDDGFIINKCVNEIKDNYNKKTFIDNVKEQEIKSNIMNSVYKAQDLYESFNNKNLVAPENIYSMINYLAERKFLTAWYMNSMFAGNLATPYHHQQQQQQPNNNILNNLLEKKTTKDDKSFLNIETLIKNEMSKECYESHAENGIKVVYSALDG